MGVFDKKVKYLNIVLNNNVFSGQIKELFKDYKEFNAITFVSSPFFFFNFIEKMNYEKVKLIIGIEDNLINEKFNLLNPEVQLDFFKNLSSETIEKIKNNDIQVRYSNLGITIHSKIYLLKKNDNTRVIIGSANFTEKALKGSNQFEELLAFDSNFNSEIVKIYTERFEEIWSQTVDFVPERLKRVEKPEIKVFSTEESLEILKENLHKVNMIGVSSEAIKDLIEEAEHEKQEIEYKKEVIKNSKDIIDILTKKTRKGLVIVKPEEVNKKQQLLSIKITRLARKSDELDTRNELIYNESDNFLYRGSKESDSLKLYSEKADIQIIKKIILKIDKFVKAYSLFTVGEEASHHTERRVFEAILYGFMSPFIWKVRDIHIKNKGRNTALADIPPFLIIAGQAWTGKTHLLEFLSRLLGTQGRYFHYGTRLKPANIRDYFYSENIFPLLVDEITKDYFTRSGTTTGEAFIKDITNTLTGRHPCFIGTTNTEFSANMQVIRRIYYLQVNRQFDKSRKSETDDYFADVITDLDDALFRDFSYRFAKKLAEVEKIINNNDFLFTAREIFKEYFNISGIKIPEYFADFPLFDYYQRGSYMWKNLFLTRKEGFMFQDDVIVVNPKIVFDGDRFEKEKAKKFLDIGIIIEDSVVLILNKDKFLNFIGLKSSNSILNKIKKFLRG